MAGWGAIYCLEQLIDSRDVAEVEIVGEEPTRVRVRFRDPESCAGMAVFIPLVGDVDVRIAGDGVSIELTDR